MVSPRAWRAPPQVGAGEAEARVEKTVAAARGARAHLTRVVLVNMMDREMKCVCACAGVGGCKGCWEVVKLLC